MATSSGKNIAYAVPQSTVSYCVAALGAGAAAPTVPVNGDFTPTTQTYPLRANKISTLASEVPTRSGVGVYVITITDHHPNILHADADVYKAGASPTAHLDASVTVVDAKNRQITVEVSTEAGVLTDLGTNDMLVLHVFAQDSTV